MIFYNPYWYLDAHWNLDDKRWSECDPKNPNRCGKAKQEPIIDCIDKTNGDVIDTTLCPEKPVLSDRECYKTCPGK